MFLFKFEVRTIKYGPCLFCSFDLSREKQGCVSYGTNGENEVNNKFILPLTLENGHIFSKAREKWGCTVE